MTQYIIAPDAAQDLEEISAYYAIHNIEAGEKLIDEFEARCKYLVSFPKIGKSYQTIRADLNCSIEPKNSIQIPDFFKKSGILHILCCCLFVLSLQIFQPTLQFLIGFLDFFQLLAQLFHSSIRTDFFLYLLDTFISHPLDASIGTLSC